jgi:hypothetical protein
VWRIVSHVVRRLRQLAANPGIQREAMRTPLRIDDVHNVTMETDMRAPSSTCDPARPPTATTPPPQ